MTFPRDTQWLQEFLHLHLMPSLETHSVSPYLYSPTSFQSVVII